MDAVRKPWEYRPGVSVHRIREDTKTIWGQMPVAPLWKLVALQCGLDPDVVSFNALYLNTGRGPGDAEWFYKQRLQLAVAHIENGTLVCTKRNDFLEKSEVQSGVYAAWSESLGPGHELPPGFPRHLHSGTSAGDAGPTASKVWGKDCHQHLDAVIEATRLWKTVEDGGNYDPLERTSAPSPEQMIAFLASRGVPSYLGKAVFTILKPSDLPPGRPPAKLKMIETIRGKKG